MTGILKKRKSNVVEEDQKKPKTPDTKAAVDTGFRAVSPSATTVRRSKRVGIINRPYRVQSDGEKRVQNTIKYIQNESSKRFESYFTFENEVKLSEMLMDTQKDDYVWTNIMDSYSQADLSNDVSDDDCAQKQLQRSLSSEIAGPVPKEFAGPKPKTKYSNANTFEQMHELSERMSRLVKDSEEKYIESLETIEELQNMVAREKLHRETAESLISELSKEYQTLRTSIVATQKTQTIEALNQEIACLELRKKTVETLSNYPKVDGVGLVDAFDKMLLSVRRCEDTIDQNPEYQQYLSLVTSLITAQKATIDSQMKEIALLHQTRVDKEKAKQLATEELAIVNNQILSSRLNSIDTICANIVTIIQSAPSSGIEAQPTNTISKNRVRAGTANKSLEPAKKWAKGFKTNIVKAANTTIQLREKSKKTASIDSLNESIE
ncbi:hypothetical protein HDV04_001554 [Boothiomyces sp. JEL0838]|nr:hypothetical protein HDV04_001554 [Boothiomyces sp. JEL0838]